MSYQPENPSSDIGTDAQRWLYDEFTRIASEFIVQDNEEGYGGISKTTDTNYGTVGVGAWTTINNWDAEMILVPKNVTQDVANSGIRLLSTGVWGLSVDISISFTGVNNGRTFGARLWNATNSTPGRVVEYSVGRNQDGINISQSANLFDAKLEDINDLLQLQIAGVDASFSNVVVIDALFSATRSG